MRKIVFFLTIAICLASCKKKPEFVLQGELQNCSSDEILVVYRTFVEALKERVKFFVERGCLVTDLSLEEPFFKIVNEEEIERIFQKALTGAELTAEEREAYKTMLFVELGREYKKYDLGMQNSYGSSKK